MHTDWDQSCIEKAKKLSTSTLRYPRSISVTSAILIVKFNRHVGSHLVKCNLDLSVRLGNDRGLLQGSVLTINQSIKFYLCVTCAFTQPA